jgi:hypothetical protein
MLTPVKHDPIDWPAVVADLVRGGYSIAAISARITVPPSTIKGWRNAGAEPHHESGEKLLILWCNATMLNRSEIPKTTHTRKPTGFRRTSWIQLRLDED